MAKKPQSSPPGNRELPPGSGKLALPGPDPYEVGYGKPPAASRFRKGQSGNPRGRPKGSRNRLPAMNEERLKDIVIAEAYRGIRVNDGNRQVTIPMAQAVIRALALNAARGQHRSQRLFSELLHRTETSLKAQHDDWLKTAIEYKADWDEELDRRKRLGLDLPEPIPHPDDITIDMNTSRVIVKGPFTKEEHAQWTWLAERRDAANKEIAMNREELASEPDAGIRAFIEKEIAYEIRFRDMIIDRIGDWPRRENDRMVRRTRIQNTKK